MKRCAQSYRNALLCYAILSVVEVMYSNSTTCNTKFNEQQTVSLLLFFKF